MLERALKGRGIGSTVVPVPRDLSSSCGYAVEADWNDAAPLLADMMNECGIEWEKVFDCDGGYRELLSEQC